MFIEGGWSPCCVLHDIAYWHGGDRKLKDIADLDFKKCIKDRGYPIMSFIMYYGVRFGSISPIKYGFRWGWGSDPDTKIKLDSQYFEL